KEVTSLGTLNNTEGRLQGNSVEVKSKTINSNNSIIVANKNVDIKVNDITARSSQMMAISEDLKIDANNSIDLSKEGNSNSEIAASKEVVITGKDININDGKIYNVNANKIEIAASNELEGKRSNIESKGDLDLDGTNKVDLRGTDIYANKLTIDSEASVNISNDITNNTNIESATNINIDGRTGVEAEGTVLAENNLEVKTESGDIDASSGTLIGKNDVNIQASGEVNLESGNVASLNNVYVKGDSVKIAGTQIYNVNGQKDAESTYVKIEANNISDENSAIDTRGSIDSEGRIDLLSESAQNNVISIKSTDVKAEGLIDIKTDDLESSSIKSDGNIEISAKNINNESGEILANGKLLINSDGTDGENKEAKVNGSETLSNTGGVLQGLADLIINFFKIDSDSSTLQSDNNININNITEIYLKIGLLENALNYQWDITVISNNIQYYSMDNI
ncbi:MAG: hypothetical protein ACPGDB_04175, partial [Fusobacterium sp.]